MFVAYQEVQAAKSGDGSVQRQPTGGFLDALALPSRGTSEIPIF